MVFGSLDDHGEVVNAAGAVSGQDAYYDAAEVEQYIGAVTATIRRLQAESQAQARRAEMAERELNGVWDRTHEREVRLLAAVNSFVQLAYQLRDQMRVIEAEAAQWRLDLATTTLASTPQDRMQSPAGPVLVDPGWHVPPPPSLREVEVGPRPSSGGWPAPIR